MFSLTIIKGRLVDDPRLQRKEKEGKETIWASYCVAVNRGRKVKGQADADFYNCIAFGRRAEYIARYGQKTTMVLVSGRLQTSYYVNKENVRIPRYQLLVDQQEICAGWKQQKEEEALARVFSHAQDYAELSALEEYLEEEELYDLPIL